MSKSVKVTLSPDFLRDLKRLRKKYPRVRADVQDLIDQIQNGATPGDQMQGVGYPVYKARVASTDMKRGKSGGFRVIYYVVIEEQVVLLTIYTKTQREDISSAEIRDRISGLPEEDEDEVDDGDDEQSK